MQIGAESQIFVRRVVVGSGMAVGRTNKVGAPPAKPAGGKGNAGCGIWLTVRLPGYNPAWVTNLVFR